MKNPSWKNKNYITRRTSYSITRSQIKQKNVLKETKGKCYTTWKKIHQETVRNHSMYSNRQMAENIKHGQTGRQQLLLVGKHIQNVTPIKISPQHWYRPSSAKTSSFFTQFTTIESPKQNYRALSDKKISCWCQQRLGIHLQLPKT